MGMDGMDGMDAHGWCHGWMRWMRWDGIGWMGMDAWTDGWLGWISWDGMDGNGRYVQNRAKPRKAAQGIFLLNLGFPLGTRGDPRLLVHNAIPWQYNTYFETIFTSPIQSDPSMFVQSAISRCVQ
jgi:hypothetical protein